MNCTPYPTSSHIPFLTYGSLGIKKRTLWSLAIGLPYTKKACNLKIDSNRLLVVFFPTLPEGHLVQVVFPLFSEFQPAGFRGRIPTKFSDERRIPGVSSAGSLQLCLAWWRGTSQVRQARTARKRRPCLRTPGGLNSGRARGGFGWISSGPGDLCPIFSRLHLFLQTAADFLPSNLAASSR